MFRQYLPQSWRISLTETAASGAGPLIADGMREKRGAGAVCGTPATSTKPERADVGVGARLAQSQHRSEAGVGALEQAAPLITRLPAERGRQSFAQIVPSSAIVLRAPQVLRQFYDALSLQHSKIAHRCHNPRIQ